MSEARYLNVEVVHQDERTSILRAVREADRRPVLIKALDLRHSGGRALERLRNEFEIGSGLDLGSIARPLALETVRGMPALVIEDTGAEPLDAMLCGPLPIETFLELASAISEAVAALHHAGVIHKDLMPEHILVHPTTRQVWLTDLGLASRLPREQQAESEPPRLIEGSFPYLSPEQTGRINRPLDPRTDLYTLGIVFYRMITGRLPFDANDPLEWVHCHVARPPAPPERYVDRLPAPLSRIVLKLLAKMPEERYQCARGLVHDLKRCLNDWRGRGAIAAFELGEFDVSDRFEIPSRLLGREEQTAKLRAAFDRVAATGNTELVAVRGDPGVGKSSLVKMLGRSVQDRALVLTGKFDKDKRDIPYSTIVQALRGLVLDILAQGEPEVSVWKERILGALGASAQVIVELIPSLELLLGKQPEIPPLPLSQAKVRFQHVFRQFLAVLATRERPLVAFLDDLQWADSASLEMFTDVLTNPETRFILSLVAYRANEGDANHAATAAVSRVRQAGCAVQEWALPPLSRDQLQGLIGGALRQPPERVTTLTDLVAERTGGNPFFAIQFLTLLHDDGLIRFDAEALVWRCDIAGARARGHTDNVVDLMVAKLKRLPAPLLETLELAACAGHIVDAAPLAELCGRTEEQVRRELRDLVGEGLMLLSGDRFRFSHDRIQQAAYALIPEERRKRTHLRLGRLLAARTPQESLNERVFDIVNQLNRSAALIATPDERLWLAELDRFAARRATATAAFGPAAGYLAAGMAMLPADAWQSRYELARDLHLERARCEYLDGSFDSAERCLGQVLTHAETLADKLAAYVVRIELSITRGDLDAAVDALLSCAGLFGLGIERHPPGQTIADRYAALMRKLGSRRIEDLASLPPTTDPDVRALLDAFVEGAPATNSDVNLTFALTCESVRLSIEYGPAPSSPCGYAHLGACVGPLLGRYSEGERFGKAGFDLAEREGWRESWVATLIVYGYLCRLWRNHIRTSVPYLETALRTGLEAGQLNYACFSALDMITVRLACGDPLEEVDQAAAGYLAFVQSARYGDVERVLLAQRRLIHRLRGQPESSSESAGLEGRLDSQMPGFRYFNHVRALQERFLFGDPGQALLAAWEADSDLSGSQMFWETCEHSLFSGLSAAACSQSASPEERDRLLRRLKAEIERNRVWAENCVANFENRYALLSAEQARVEGHPIEAEQHYEQAIRSARENGFVQNEALAWELASRHYEARGLAAVAETYLREARACYLRWGAEGKVRELDRLLLRPLLRPLIRTPAATTTFALRSEELDLLSVTKASQTISGQLRLDRLVGTLLEVALEQSGAQRGALLLAKGDELTLEAEAAMEEEQVVTRLLASSLVDPSKVPVAIVRRAQVSLEPVVVGAKELDEAAYASDPYLASARPRSALGLPIVSRGNVAGVLYLENRLASGAFTAERLSALELIASQAAISTENARLLAEESAMREAAEGMARQNAELVESLREANQHKDEFLALLGHELRNPLAPITNSIHLLKRAGRGDPEVTRAVAVIDRQTEQLSRLVDDLLDVTRVTRGTVQLRRSVVDFAELIQRTADDHRAAFVERGLELDLAIPPTPVWVEGDRARLVQVVGNLLSNALKFTAPGGRVSLEVGMEDSGHVVLAVSDTGEGIDAATLARLFQPFAQAKRSADRSQGGLGLGLALVKEIVVLHGGEVRASSEGLGRGARLTVKLPLAAQASHAPVATARPALERAKRRVLIIEDNEDAASSLRDLLELEGQRVQVAATGREGVSTAEEYRPEVVICDIGLPAGMDGYAVARALRADTRTAGARLIALTGYAQPEDRRLALEAGFDAHLSKPPDLDTIMRLLALPPNATASMPTAW